MNEDLAREVHGALLTPVRLREGYDMGQVDDFLDRLEVAVVADGSSVQSLVAGARFASVRFREGYDMTEVDRLLERISGEVVRRAAAGQPTAGETGTARSSPLERAPLEDGRHPGPYPTSAEAGSVIAEQQGLLSRLFRRK